MLFIITKIQHGLQQGQLPTESSTDGLIILVGAVLLITPGFITDILGFVFLIPEARKLLKKFIVLQFKNYITRNNGYSEIHCRDKEGF